MGTGFRERSEGRERKGSDQEFEREEVGTVRGNYREKKRGE